MQEISTMQASGSDNFKGPQVTIGLDLGDRSSNYCVLNGAGDILLEDKLPTTSQAMKQLFGRMLRSRIAMETGTHSPWVSRLDGAGPRSDRGARPEGGLDRQEPQKR